MARPDGDESEEACKLECAKDSECSAVEYYESGFHGPCLITRGKGNVAVAGDDGD